MSEARRVLDSSMSEDQFLALVKEYAELRGWRFYHPWRSDHSVKGYPDCTMIRNGFLIFAELKREEKKLTHDQEMWRLDISLVESRAMQIHNDKDPWPVRYYVWQPSDWAQIEEVLR